MLYWLRCCNVGITTCNLECFHSFDITPPIHNVVSALSQRWTVNSSRSMNIEMTTSKQRWKRDIRFTTSCWSWYYDVVATLRQLSEECEMWTIHPIWRHLHKLACLYAGSILWHQTQVIISRSYSKRSPKKCFQKVKWWVAVLQSETL